MTERTFATRLVFPALGPLYARLSLLGEPLVRLAAGGLLVPHGAQKLFGAFGGMGLEGTAQFFASNLTLTPGLLWALFAGVTEFAGGLLLALGLFTRPAAAAVFALMALELSRASTGGGFFFTVELGKGFFWADGGYEFPTLWALAALSFLFRGGGRLSLDALVGREL